MKILCWGRGDYTYSRNRIVSRLFARLGHSVTYYQPKSSRLGWLEASIRPPDPADLIWVPCFRQADMAAARLLAQRWSVPLLFDPLISAYQKQVEERHKYPASSRQALRLLAWERKIFHAADLVVADTQAHAAYFQTLFDLQPNQTGLLYVGAESDCYFPRPLSPGPPWEILFTGSFQELQGVETIIAAARQMPDKTVTWTLLGDGRTREDAVRLAQGATNIRFEPWISQQLLPDRMAQAHILLGIFGTTPKAARVMPNKVFQAMALGRPLITMRSAAYPEGLSTAGTIGWVPAGDPTAITRKVESLLANSHQLPAIGAQTSELYKQFFDTEQLSRMLQKLLQQAGANFSRSRTAIRPTRPPGGGKKDSQESC